MEKRYQVFVSSTFTDLQEERKEVMQALLELGCIPSGMELFPAANMQQWELIKKVIQDCDYYVLIIGGRYGSLGPDGLSYTEMEYRYATSLNKPTIAFLHRNPGEIIAAHTEASDDGKKKLEAFRSLVQNKLCRFWATADQLGSAVSRSLIQLFNTDPALGWVRADKVASEDARAEILRLRERIEELQDEIKTSRTTPPPDSISLQQDEDEFEVTLSYSVRHEGVWSRQSSDLSVTWTEIFNTIAPHLLTSQSDSELRSLFVSRLFSNLKETKKTKNTDIQNPVISDGDWYTVAIQLRSLGLIEKDASFAPVYWKLTPYGDQVMTHNFALRKPIAELESPSES